MKRAQTKFHADVMSYTKAIRSKKSKFFNKSKFSCNRVFHFVDILLKLHLQHHTFDVLLQV